MNQNYIPTLCFSGQAKSGLVKFQIYLVWNRACQVLNLSCVKSGLSSFKSVLCETVLVHYCHGSLFLLFIL